MPVTDPSNEIRVSMQVSLTPHARDVVERLKAESGVAKQESVARVLEWFAAQSKEFRLAVITNLADPIELEVQARLKALDSQGGAPLPFEQAAARIKDLLDLMVASNAGKRREVAVARAKPKDLQ